MGNVHTCGPNEALVVSGMWPEFLDGRRLITHAISSTATCDFGAALLDVSETHIGRVVNVSLSSDNSLIDQQFLTLSKTNLSSRAHVATKAVRLVRHPEALFGKNDTVYHQKLLCINRYISYVNEKEKRD